MTFEVTGDAYDRFMGRYSRPLAADLADWLEVAPGQRAIDVGCGPGALTGILVDRLGPDRVAAVDPSTSFVAACRDWLPGVDVRRSRCPTTTTPSTSPRPAWWSHPSFEEWWEPYLHGVGPAGDVVAALGPAGRARLEEVLRRRLGDGPFDLTAVACARGRA